MDSSGSIRSRASFLDRTRSSDTDGPKLVQSPTTPLIHIVSGILDDSEFGTEKSVRVCISERWDRRERARWGGAEGLDGYDLLVLEKMVETERKGASFLPISSSQNCGGSLEVQSGQIEARFSMDPSASF